VSEPAAHEPAAPAPPVPVRRTSWLYTAALLAYALDRLTKVLAEVHLADRPPIELIPGVLQLNFTENPGGAFSLFTNAQWLFFGATIVISAVIVLASFRVTETLPAIALGLVLGGALGNLTDRLIRGEGLFDGRVVDFVDLHVWPVFNVADSAIVVGAGLMLLASFRHGD
jgi:signal peptidase II